MKVASVKTLISNRILQRIKPEVKLKVVRQLWYAIEEAGCDNLVNEDGDLIITLTVGGDWNDKEIL